MWRNFTIEALGRTWQCEAKVYDRPSMFGVRGSSGLHSRVSKLNVYNDDGMVRWGYDRGWGVGREQAPIEVIDAVLAKFPNSPAGEATS